MQCSHLKYSLIFLICLVSFEFVKSQCVRDYTGPCPEGWSLSFHKSDSCVSPLSYHGPCSSEIISSNNKVDKVILESKCKVKWPCMELCERDLDRCPKGWLKKGDSCFPSSSYWGSCNYPIALKSMEMTQKIVWSMKCGSKFFCKKSCERDYSSKCPEVCESGYMSFQGWKLAHGNCEAPQDYNGPCHSIANVSFFSRKMKEEFEVVCNVAFPCKAKK